MKEEKIKQAIDLLKTMTEEERMEVLICFCMYCGTLQPEDPLSIRCQCWNDD